MYLLKFAGGTTKRVSREQAWQIDEMWSKNPESKKIIKFKDGSRVLLSTLVEILPEEYSEDNFPTAIKENQERIVGYLGTSLKGKPSKKKEWWLEKIKENIQRIKNGKKWIHYDTEGNKCTKEEALLSITGDDNLVVDK